MGYKYLYKFYSEEAFRINTIKDNKLWLSKANFFNDPFEGCLEYPRAKFAAKNIMEFPCHKDNALLLEMKKHLEENLDDIDFIERKAMLLSKEGQELFYYQYSKIAEAIYKTRTSDMFYVASFAEFDDKEILKNILMWSHYANCHRGFCVRYKINDDSLLCSHFHKVNYSIDFPRLKDDELRVLVDETPELYQQMVKKRLTTKAKQWEYEKEIRLIIPSDFPELEIMERGGKLLFDCVDGIYLGLEMSEENGKSLLEFAKEKDILSEVYCMYRHESKFELCSHHYQCDLRYRDFV